MARSLFRRQPSDRLISELLQQSSSSGEIAREYFEVATSITPIAWATRRLSGFWPNTYTGTPTVGVASAGTSGGNDQTTGATGWADPTIGTGLNGIASSVWDGAITGRAADDSTTTMLGTGGWSYACLMRTSSLAVRTTSYANPPLWSDNNSILGVTVSDGGISAFIFDTLAVEHETPPIPFPNATWVWVQVCWDRSKLSIRLNNGRWSRIDVSDYHSTRGTDIWFGKTGYATLDGEKLVEMFSPECWAPQIFDGIGAQVEAAYDIQLGFNGFPGTEEWSGAWEAPYAGSPWIPEASAGLSVENGALVNNAFPPSVGSLANGYASAHFNGVSGKLSNAYELDRFIDPFGWSVSGVVAATSVAARSVGAAYLDAPIVAQDVNGLFSVTFTADGICVGYYDGAGFTSAEIVQACPADGLPHTFHAWYDGWLNLVVDGVAATRVPAIAFYGGAGSGLVGFGILKVGENYDGTKLLDGEIWALRLAKKDIGPTARANLESYWQTRYFVAAVSPIAGTVGGTCTVTATAKGTGRLIGSAAGTCTPTATARGAGGLTGSSAGTCAVTGAVTASGRLVGSSPGTCTVTATTTGTGVLVGSTAGTSTVTGFGRVLVPIVGSAAGTSTVTGAVTATGRLLGSSAGTATPSATLVATGRLIGSTAGTTTSTAIAAGAGRLTGTSAGTSAVLGTVVATGQLVGSSVGLATVAATVAGAGALAGTSASTCTVTGTGSTGASPGDIVGSSAGTSTASATLGAAGRLVGTSAGTATATAPGTASGRLLAAVAGLALAAGVLLGVGRLAGTSAGSTVSTASASGTGAASGLSAGLSTATATLQATADLNGAASGSSIATALLRGAGALSGQSIGTSTCAVSFGSTGSIAGTCTVEGTLRGAGELAGSSAGTCTAVLHYVRPPIVPVVTRAALVGRQLAATVTPSPPGIVVTPVVAQTILTAVVPDGTLIPVDVEGEIE